RADARIDSVPCAAGCANTREMLDAGFTTVRDVGNAGNYADSDLRRVEEWLVSGSTIVNARSVRISRNRRCTRWHFAHGAGPEEVSCNNRGSGFRLPGNAVCLERAPLLRSSAP